MKRALLILFALLPVALFAQQSGVLNYGYGTVNYSFTHDSATNRVTVVISTAASSPWYAEYGVSIGEQGQTPVSGVTPSVGWGGAAGTYSFAGTAGSLLTIRANGRNGANGQGTAVVTATWRIGESDKRVTVSLRNDRDVTVIYKLVQNGTVIGQVTLQPGEGLIQSFNAPSGADVTVVESVSGVGFDGTSWAVTPGAVTEKNVGTVTPHPQSTPPAIPPAIPQSPDIPKKLTPTPPPADAPVWGPTTPPAGTADLLGQKDFRAGVDKIVDAQNATTRAVSAASSSQAARDETRDTKLDGIASKLDSANAKADAANTKAGEGNALLDAIKTNTFATASKLDTTNARLDTANARLQELVDLGIPELPPDKYDERASAAATAADAAWLSAQTSGGAANSAARSAVSKSVPSLDGGGPSSAPFWSIQLGTHGTLNLDISTEFDGVAGFTRGVLAWVILGLFQWWLWSEFQRILSTISLTPQARGNAVFGGTGGQATSLLAAAAIAGIIVSVPSVYWAYTEGLGVSAGFSGNPLSSASGPASAGVGLLYFWVPVGTLVSSVTAAFLVKKFGIALTLGTQAAIRFVVP